MRKLQQTLLAALALSLSLVACDKAEKVDKGNTPDKPAATNPPPTDQWLGLWSGVEGTSLELRGGNGKYEIVIADLDGPKTFHGTGDGDHISFERNGVAETIRATNGADTGMKWLTEKSNCLTIRTGEGFCRD
ncbi:MAG: hypothetical protein ABW110_03335 [Steroidobacteraceae bacterium]